MATWRLRPIAQPNDPRWQRRRIWREAIVRARTAAEARLVAASLERLPDEPPNGNESESFRGGFLDEKLYRVDRVDDEEGPPAVLDATPASTALL